MNDDFEKPDSVCKRATASICDSSFQDFSHNFRTVPVASLLFLTYTRVIDQISENFETTD